MAPPALPAAAWLGAPDEALVQLAGTVDPGWLPQGLRGRVVTAVGAVLEGRAQAATTSLVVLAEAAAAAGRPLDDDQRADVATEVDARRGTDGQDQLYRLSRTSADVDFAATAGVLLGAAG